MFAPGRVIEAPEDACVKDAGPAPPVQYCPSGPQSQKSTRATELITKSLVVAVFVLPAASPATPSVIRRSNLPAVFTTTPEFVAVNV